VRILITGVAGQDGTILAHQALQAGDEVLGMVKPSTDVSLLMRYAPDISVVECDLSDHRQLRQVIRDFNPSQIYNLGGWSTIGDSWDHQEEVRHINVDSVAVILEELSKLSYCSLFQASSAAIFEGTDVIPQTERTQRAPQTPYARSKADAMALVDDARSNGMFAVSGILYNHESPLRGDSFVTRRVTMGVARIAAGRQEVLELGDLEVARDWGWAPDYVRAMRLMLSAPTPHDYVLATGISHRLSFFVSRSFQAAGITDWERYVVSTSERKRKADTNTLVGDSRSAFVELGWRHTCDFDAIAATMTLHDIELLRDPTAMWLPT
jgi:GDPmannose 4,6-dehydratase